MKFFPEKIIELHCYTCRSDVYNFAPIQETKKISRGWFSRHPVDKKRASAKACPSLRGVLSAGATMPMWSDLHLQVTPPEDKKCAWKYQYSDAQSSIEQHWFDQMGQPEQDANFVCLKLISPWLFSCREDVDFLLLGDQLELLKYGGVEIMQGQINFKHQSGTNINTLVRKKESGMDFILPFRFPLVKFIPLTSKKLKVVNHLVSKNEWESLQGNNIRVSFSLPYYKKRNVLKGKKEFNFLKPRV